MIERTIGYGTMLRVAWAACGRGDGDLSEMGERVKKSSGNPAERFGGAGPGRPKGSPNKATAEVRDLALEHGPAAVAELARLTVEAQSETARIAACNAIIERAYGRAVSGRMIQLNLPKTDTPEGVLKAVSAVVQAVAGGQITPGEGGDICGVLESQRRAIDTNDLARRIEVLEAKQK